ncbi:Uncharacterised protein [Klebsiella oxytoca]|nr:Uncharacterised protein [Klebsiella oxytoca]
MPFKFRTNAPASIGNLALHAGAVIAPPAARCESVYTQSTSPPADKDNYVLPSLPYALSRYGIPALRPQRAEAARRLARAVAQLRRRHAVRQRPWPDPLRLRSRHYPFRSGQQLRPTARRRRGELWPHSQRRSAGLARRTDRLVQSRLHHVARPLRRLGLEKVPGRQPRSEPEAHGVGVCGYLLSPPAGSGHAAGRNHGGVGSAGAPGQSAVCRPV